MVDEHQAEVDNQVYFKNSLHYYLQLHHGIYIMYHMLLLALTCLPLNLTGLKEHLNQYANNWGAHAGKQVLEGNGR